MELMVSLAITALIVTVLVSVTNIALNTWNRSRLELRASRQAKTLLNTMSRDLEALVVRSGNEFEWFYASVPSNLPGDNVQSTNAAELIFFCAATDRYNGAIGTTSDLGGDISCVSYQLEYKDPVLGESGGTNVPKTFVMNRLIVNPDETLSPDQPAKSLLGQTDLYNAFSPYKAQITAPTNFVCENIYQFTLTFNVKVTDSKNSEIKVPIVLGDSGSAKEFQIFGTGIQTDGKSPVDDVKDDQLKAGQLQSVVVSITVLTDAAVDQMRVRKDLQGDKLAKFLLQNSYQYSKEIIVPTP